MRYFPRSCTLYFVYLFTIKSHDAGSLSLSLSGLFSFLDSSPRKQHFLQRKEFFARFLLTKNLPSVHIQYDMHSKTILLKRIEGSLQTNEVLFYAQSIRGIYNSNVQRETTESRENGRKIKY